MQLDRLQLIRDNHHNNLWLEAYRHSLNNWPLFVPPFVIKNESLPLLATSEQGQLETIVVNCIMTPSMDSSFNLKVFPKLDENLAQFFSKYWATNSIKAVRYYQQAWRNDITDVGSKMHDLKAHLSDVPTIVLSPLIEDNKVKFSFSWWGFSGKAEDEHILEADNTYDPELTVEVTPNTEYTTEAIKTILDEASSKLAAFISYFADLYYWNYYHLTPTLPFLLSKELLHLDGKSKREHIKTLIDLVKQFDAKEDSINIENQIDFVDSISKLCDSETRYSIAHNLIKQVNSCPSLPVSTINSIKKFSERYRLVHCFNENHFLTEEYEEVQIIEGVSLDNHTIETIFKELSKNSYRAMYVAYINWTENVVIGTFCTADGNMTIYGSSNTYHYVVLMNDFASNTDEITYNNNDYIHITSLTNSTMNKKPNQESLRQNIGRRLIRMGEHLSRQEGNHSTPSQGASSDPWGNAPSPAPQVDEIQAITSFFVASVDNQAIPYSRQDETMSIAPVLNWLDSLSDEEVGVNNQVYIIKSLHKQSGKIIYCTFLAKNDIFDLKTSPKICFICDTEPSEMKELFNGKLIYIIPFHS